MPKNAQIIDPSIVDETPAVWFIRLQDAVKKRDVRRALEAQKQLQNLGFDVNLLHQEGLRA